MTEEGSAPTSPSPFFIQVERLGFFHLCRKAQHYLTEGQHHFEQSENIIVRLRTQMSKPQTALLTNLLSCDMIDSQGVLHTLA